MDSARSVKLLHVIPSLGVGGAENHLLQLIEGTVDAGHDVTVIYLTEEDPFADTDLTAEMREAGAAVHHIPIRGRLDPLGLLRLILHVRQAGYDLVHTHQIYGDFYGSIAGAITGKPVVSTKHNDPPVLTKHPYRAAHELSIRLTDRIITISDNVREWVLENTSADTGRIDTVYYGLDPAPFDDVDPAAVARTRAALLDGGDELLGTVARLTEQKDLETLIRAFAKVQSSDSGPRLAIVGDGPRRDRLETLASDLGVDDRITFTGFRDDVPVLMHAFDVFVLPSRWEGFGLVLLEAMAARTPIVASAVSAIPEVVDDGRTGYLVTPGDAEAFASTIESMLSEESTAATMGEAGRERLESRFAVSRMVTETLDVYDIVLGATD